jgi:hypothetical protein
MYSRVRFRTPQVSTSIKVTVSELAVDVDREPEIGWSQVWGTGTDDYFVAKPGSQMAEVFYRETDAVHDVPRSCSVI